MSTKANTEKIIFQDDDHPRILVTPSRLTVGNINYALSGVSDVRFDIKSKVMLGAGLATAEKWPHLIVFGVLVLLGLLFPPVFIAAFAYTAWITYIGRDQNKYDIVRITFTRANKKVVCYEDDLGKKIGDRRKGLREIKETEKDYKQRCERYTSRRERARRIVDAIGEAIEK